MEETEKKKKGRPKKQEQTAQEKNGNEAAQNAGEKEQQITSEEPQKRRRGRPRKVKTDEQNIALETSTETLTESEDKDTKKKTRQTQKACAGKTAASFRSRKKKDAEEEKLALTAENRKALAAGATKELPCAESGQNFPAPQQAKEIAVPPAKDIAVTGAKEIAIPAAKEIAVQGTKDVVPQSSKEVAVQSAKDVAVYEQGQIVPVRKNEDNKRLKAPKKRGRKSNKESQAQDAKTAETSANASNEQGEASKGGAKKNAKDSADFVAGMNGIVENSGTESLGFYGEQAGLGVLGVIEEAPFADAILPLVSDSETEIAPKRAKKRGRKKKAVKETAAAQEFSPIVEDGEMALIEAEESLRKAKKSKKEAAETKEHIRRVLYVSTVPDEQVEVVITENGVVSEYFVEMAHQSKIRGNIYKGVINNVDANLQAAFVNFGCGKNGFLQIDEVHPEYYLVPHDDKSTKYPPIQKVLKAGQEILVQVVKEPNGSKGAFLTTWLSLPGRFLVLTPGQEQIGVSRKVEDNEERQRLRSLLGGIKPGENMGIIIRTASEGASKTHIHKDLQLLKRTWKNIQKQVVKSPAPSLIYQEADLATRAVRDYLNEEIDEVWVDSKDVQKSVSELIKVLYPKNKEMLHLYDDKKQTLWEHFNITRQLDEVTKREVNLPSGGRLVFDQTEALMAIDINSGKSQGKSNFEAMVYRTNMEAVEAIARHLRLRDIGGQVVIDFIEMRDKAHCKDVENAMHAAMKRDRARHDIGKLSNFGLLELVRQRTGSSVISISSEPCPYCRGTGFRRNLEWQAQGVLRDIRSKLAGKNVPSTYVHHVDQEIAFYLLNKKRDRLNELEHEFNVKIEIHLK